jgi:hypothetical protein
MISSKKTLTARPRDWSHILKVYQTICLKKIVNVVLVGEIKYEYAILIGTSAGRGLLQALDIDGFFYIIIGFIVRLKVSAGFCCLNVWNSGKHL